MLNKKCPALIFLTEIESGIIIIPSDNGLTEFMHTRQVGDEESREHLIKTHYMARVAELTTQLQMSDSKAVHFHAEVSTIGLTFRDGEHGNNDVIVTLQQ